MGGSLLGKELSERPDGYLMAQTQLVKQWIKHDTEDAEQRTICP